MVFQFDTIYISMVRIVIIRIIRMVMSCQNGFLAGWKVICMAFWMVKIVLKMVKWISSIQVSIQKVSQFEQLLSVLSQVGRLGEGHCSTSWGHCKKYYFLLGTKRAQPIVVIHKKILLNILFWLESLC